MNERSGGDQIITFQSGDGGEAEFKAECQTTLGGVNYLLVTDVSDGESFLVLRENKAAETGETAAYDIVESEEELEAVVGIFDELLEDVDLEV